MTITNNIKGDTAADDVEVVVGDFVSLWQTSARHGINRDLVFMTRAQAEQLLLVLDVALSADR